MDTHPLINEMRETLVGLEKAFDALVANISDDNMDAVEDIIAEIKTWPRDLNKVAKLIWDSAPEDEPAAVPLAAPPTAEAPVGCEPPVAAKVTRAKGRGRSSAPRAKNL